MKQRSLLSFLIALLVGATVWHFDLFQLTGKNSSCIEAVPSSTPLTFIFDDVDLAFQQLQKMPYGKSLSEAGFAVKLNQDWKRIRQFVLPELEGLRLASGLQISGSDNFEFLHVLESEVPFSETLMLERLKTANIETTLHEFNQVKIYEVQTKSPFTFAVVKGLLVYSASSFIVEEGINTVLDDNGFSKAQIKAIEQQKNKGEGALALNYKGLMSLSSILVESKYEPVLKKISRVADFTVCNFKMTEQGVQLNGITFAEGEQTLQAIRKGERTENLLKYVPEQVAFMHRFAFKAIYEALIESRSNTEQWEKYFRPWMGEELLLFGTETYQTQFAEAVGVVLQTVDSELAISSLRRLNQDIEAADSAYFEVNGTLVYRIEDAAVMGNLLHHSILPIGQPYFAVKEDVLLMASSADLMESMLQQQENGQSLHSNVIYQRFSKVLSPESGLFTYLVPSKMEEVLNEILKGQSVDLNGFDASGVLFSKISGLRFNTNAYFTYNPSSSEGTRLLWRKSISKDLMGRVRVIENHETNTQNILVQDKDYVLYQLDNAGEVLWKKPLGAPVLGDIQQIDFYKNGKLQIVFNTRNRIYVIDRKGRDVSGYPIKLPADATTGMFVVHYDAKKNYRFFVGCSNNAIYGYQWSGKPLNGWQPKKISAALWMPMQHASVGGKDYLLAYSKDFKLHVLDRKGQARFKAVDLGQRFMNPFRLQSVGGKPHFVNVYGGQLYKVSLDGQLSISKIAGFEGTGKGYINVPANQYLGVNPAFIQIGSGDEHTRVDLQVTSAEGVKLKRQDFWLTTNGSDIAVIDEVGLLLPKFPALGESLPQKANLFNDGSIQLVTTAKGSVLVYQVNLKQ